MWITKSLLDLFSISKDHVANLSVALATECHKNEILSRELTSSKILNDWMRMQVNSLQMERVALMEKAYGIKIPAPEIVRTPVVGQDTKQEEFTFEDIGEEMAKKLGLPTYSGSFQ